VSAWYPAPQQANSTGAAEQLLYNGTSGAFWKAKVGHFKACPGKNYSLKWKKFPVNLTLNGK